MTKKGRVVFISLLAVVCLSAYAYGNKSDKSGDGRVNLSTSYFKNDSVVIAAEFENDLKKVQAALKADPAIGLQIEAYGHNHGTPEKNRLVGTRRVHVLYWYRIRCACTGKSCTDTDDVRVGPNRSIL